MLSICICDFWLRTAFRVFVYVDLLLKNVLSPMIFSQFFLFSHLLHLNVLPSGARYFAGFTFRCMLYNYLNYIKDIRDCSQQSITIFVRVQE